MLPILVVWAAIGFSAALLLLLRRRGREFLPAALLGISLGPRFIPLAVRDLRAHVPGERSIVIEPAPRRGGAVDVLVSADLVEAEGGLAGTIERHVGHSYGRLMIAAAIDYESAQAGVLSDRARRTAHRLEVAALTMEPRHTAGRVLVAGPQVAALLDYATRHRYELVILGPGAHLRRSAEDGPLVVRVDAR